MALVDKELWHWWILRDIQAWSLRSGQMGRIWGGWRQGWS